MLFYYVSSEEIFYPCLCFKVLYFRNLALAKPPTLGEEFLARIPFAGLLRVLSCLQFMSFSVLAREKDRVSVFSVREKA